MRKCILAILAALVPAAASASGFEAVTYPSCTYVSREASSSILTGLSCGTVDYGDCAYASFSPDDVVSLTCRDYAISRLVSASSSGNTFEGVSLARLPRSTVSLPLVSSSGGLRLASLPTGDVTLDVNGLQEVLVVVLALWLGIKFVLFVIRRAWFLFA